MMSATRKLVALSAAALTLVGCSGSPAPEPTVTVTAVSSADGALTSALDTCLVAYAELPRSIDVLTEQSGEQATVSTPCENWIESQGEDGFTDFWTNPAKFIPYVISAGGLEALHDAGLGG